MQCPNCQANLDTHREVGDDGVRAGEPGPGDTSVCFHCMSFNICELDPDDQLILRRSTVEEMAEFKASVNYKNVMQVLLGYR